MTALGLALAVALSAGPALRVVEMVDGRARAGTAVFLRAGERRLLAAVVEDGDRCRAAVPVELDGRSCAPLPEAAVRSLRWALAVPEARDYDNVRACGLAGVRRGCHAPIAWSVRDLAVGQGTIEVSSVPDLAALGTHRVGIRMAWGDGTLDSVLGLDGPTDAQARALYQVVVRLDDTYVGYLTEQLGTPFVFFPARLPGGAHQTDERLGADCAALLVYGRRRLGERVQYVAPGGLRRFAAPVGDGPVQPGDVLHFGFQTAALSRDLPPIGRIDPGDLVIHTFHGVAEEVPVASLPYRDMPVEVLRWTGAETAGR